jgi:hypothetical protein
VDFLIARDGPVCVWCGRERWPRDLNVEHVLPRARGGRTVPENLVVACRQCNRARGTKPVVAYVRERIKTGGSPSADALRLALERLSGSESGLHAAYGARQLELLARVARERSA